MVTVYKMQFDFMPEKGTLIVFILRSHEEEHHDKGRAKESF